MIFTMFGAAMVVNHNSLGWFSLAIGLGILTYMLVGWFSIVSRESEHGDYNRKVDVSFRWGMSWFIFSEVMFFASFFGALFYARVISLPLLGLRSKLLWTDFLATWPLRVRRHIEPFTRLGPCWCRRSPGTALSGACGDNRAHALRAISPMHSMLAITIVLGVTFWACRY